MRSVRVAFLSILFCYGLTLGAVPLETPKPTTEVEVGAKVDKAIVKTGENFTYILTIKSPPGVTLKVSEFGQALQGVRLLSVDEDKPKLEDGKQISVRYYKMVADFSGSYIMPAVEVSYEESTTKDLKHIKTSEIFVEVKSEAKASKEKGSEAQLYDIKPLVAPPSILKWWHIVLILIGVVLIGVFGFWYYRRWKKGQQQELVPSLPPAEKALQALSDLDREESLQKLKYFHFTLSLTLRTYVEEQMQFKATDMTLEEIKRNLHLLQSVDMNLKKQFMVILTQTDLVKFTDTVLSINESKDLLEKTRDFIIQTRPQMVQEESVV